MAQNTPILGKIKSSESAASLDAKYGPYASKAAANAALGENGDDVITAGLTVGVTQSDGSIKEFWYQPDGQGGLQLVEKQVAGTEVEANPSGEATAPLNKIKIGETNYNIPEPISDIKFVGRNSTTGFPDVSDPIEHIIYACLRGSQDDGANSAYDFYTLNQGTWQNISQGQKGDGNFTFIKYSENQPTQDSDIHDVFSPSSDKFVGFYNGTSGSAPSDYEEYTWCKFMGTSPEVTIESITGGNRVTITDEANPSGQSFTVLNGADAVNPFKGWYTSSSNLPANPAVGEYAYVKGATASDPVSIYECTTAGSWSDSGRTFNPANNQEFASGEDLNTVCIDSSNLVNPVSDSLAKAEDVLPLKAKLGGVTASETKANFTIGDGYINASGNTTGTTTNAHAEITLSNGANSIRFLGLVLTSEASSTIKSYSYSFYDDNDTPISPKTYDIVESVQSGTTDSKEYIISIPDNAVKFMCSIGGNNRDNFYCYLQSGNTVSDIIEKTTNDIADSVRIFDNFLYIGATSLLSFYINSSGTLWKSKTNTYPYYSFVAPIENVKNIRVITTEQYARIAFLKNDSHTADTVPSYCDNTNLITIEKGDTKILEVPNDCNYLYVFAGSFTIGQLPTIEKCNDSDVPTELEIIKSDVYSLMDESPIELGDTSSTYYIVTDFRTTLPCTGRWSSSRRHYERAIPEKSKYVKIVANKNSGTAYSFFTERSADRVEDGIPPYVNGVDQAFTIAAGETIVTEIPEDAEYLYIQAGKSGVLAEKPQYAAFLSTPEKIEPYDILELYPDVEIHPKMLALQKGSGGPSSTGGIKPNTFIFGHITDCHGGENAGEGSVSNRTWKRFLKFSNHWKEKGFIDDIVDTGDMVGNVFSNSIAWRTNADDVLNVIGNHDTATVSNKVYNWTAKAGKDAYDKFVSPYIENWGVVQPDNADTEGYCYYYKDYERTSNGNTIKLRCIFVDVMGWDDNNVQKSWLDNVLEDARVNGLVVCIFTHFVPVRTRPLKCAFTSKTLGVSTEDFPYHGFNTFCKQLCACVRTFQDNGGIFACYIAGHRHILGIAQVYGNVTIDGTSYNFDDESKPQIVVYGTAGYVNLGNLNDYFKEANTKNEDNFQIVAIDTFKGINDDIASSSFRIKVLKIGCNYNRHMQLADVVDVTYYPYQPFDAANQNYTIGTIVNKDNVLYRIIKPVYTNGSFDWENSVVELASRIVNE